MHENGYKIDILYNSNPERSTLWPKSGAVRLKSTMFILAQGKKLPGRQHAFVFSLDGKKKKCYCFRRIDLTSWGTPVISVTQTKKW